MTKEIENDKEFPIKVPLKLTDPDKLIIAAKESLNNKKPFKWDFVGCVDTNRGELTICIAQANTNLYQSTRQIKEEHSKIHIIYP